MILASLLHSIESKWCVLACITCEILLDILCFKMIVLTRMLGLSCLGFTRSMALQKYIPSGDAPSVSMKPLSFSSKVQEKAQLADPEGSPTMDADVDIDLREVYFLIMHFLSAGPCHRTYGQFWNELLEHQLLPRRYHAWYSRSGLRSGDENDDGSSFPLSYNKLVERYIICFLSCSSVSFLVF